MKSKIEQIGIVGNDIVQKFNLNISPLTPIYIGETNRNHMKNSHLSEYNSYCNDISDIIKNPDYVGINPNDLSLEYYKDFGGTTIHIKIAVRPTGNNIYFVKTMYEIKPSKFSNYLNSGRIKKT